MRGLSSWALSRLIAHITKRGTASVSWHTTTWAEALQRAFSGETNMSRGGRTLKDVVLDQLIIAAIAAALLVWPWYIQHKIFGE